MVRLASLLAACALLACHVLSTHAAPARSSSESTSDHVTLTDHEARRLLSAIVKEFMQMTLEEREQQASEGNRKHSFESQNVIRKSVTVVKRGCNTATCVTQRLADFLSRSGGMGNSDFVPTYVGAKAFGRRRRYSPM